MSAYAVSSRGLAAHKVPQGVLATIMEMLYSNSEQGIAKLDFSDFTGMYQDRARTIPYTAVEQPLGSFTGLNGTTATAPADVNRGVVSARVNLLEKSEDLTDAYWSKDGVTALGNVLTETATTGEHQIQRNVSCGIGESFTFGVTASANERGWLLLIDDSGGGYAYFDLDNAVVGTENSLAKASIVDDGTGKLKCAIEATSVDTFIRFRARIALGDATNTSYAGDGVSSINIFNAFITTTSNAHLPYQRVNTATDYDTVGFPHYLTFNGTNTCYTTPSIDFTGTDKMTVWAGVTKLSDATMGALLEMSANSSTTAGTLMLRATDYPSGPEYTVYGRGASAYVGVVAGIAAAPSTRLLTGKVDFAAATGQQVLARLNGVNGGAAATDTGGGSFIAAPLYIGARAGTSFYFNGRLYGLIVRGAQSSLSQIEATELYIKRKMRLP